MRAFFIGLTMFFVLSACSSQLADTPEQQVRQLLTEAELIAERRDWQGLSELVADQYKDSAKRTKKTLVQLIAGYFFQHRSIHLWVRVGEIGFNDNAQAQVTLYVAMAGTAFPTDSLYAPLRTDLHRMDLLFERHEDSWRLLEAQWRRLNLLDVLPDVAS